MSNGGPSFRTGRAAGRPAQWATAALAVALAVLAAAVMGASLDDRDGRAVQAGGPPPTALVLGESITTVETTLPTEPPAAFAGAPSGETAAPPPTSTTTTARTATRAAAAVPAATTTTAPAPAATTTSAPATTTTTAAAPTTTTTVDPCRNSTAPACGPFRFDPQPGADNPMTVEVTVDPASPTAGQPVLFTLTLRDPDGVSHGSSTFGFGDSGIGNSGPFTPCTKHGPWDPPPRDPAHATEVQEVRHTYDQPGSYTAVFSFEAGPFACVDSVTGRGDRPYASSAATSVVVEVG